MSKDELALPVHRRTILFQSEMENNDTPDWEISGTPDWSNTDYLVLNQLESVTSLMEFRYGVLTFDARASDWTLAAMGFYFDSVNNVMFWADEFDAYKHSIHGGPDAIALVDNTWYHFIIIWCPQFASIEVYGLDDTLVADSRLRSPPNKSMPIFFYALNAAVSLDIASVTVQEGDDSSFFLEAAAGVPANVIAAWYGTDANCPSGWTICDGRARPAGSAPANTPDLSASFIKGAAVDGDVGGTGGSTTHQHAAPVGYLASDDPITLRGSDAPYGTTGIANRAMSRKGYDWQQYSATVKLTSSAGNEPTYYRLYWIMKD